MCVGQCTLKSLTQEESALEEIKNSVDIEGFLMQRIKARMEELSRALSAENETLAKVANSTAELRVRHAETRRIQQAQEERLKQIQKEFDAKEHVWTCARVRERQQKKNVAIPEHDHQTVTAAAEDAKAALRELERLRIAAVVAGIEVSKMTRAGNAHHPLTIVGCLLFAH